MFHLVAASVKETRQYGSNPASALQLHMISESSSTHSTLSSSCQSISLVPCSLADSAGPAIQRHKTLTPCFRPNPRSVGGNPSVHRPRCIHDLQQTVPRVRSKKRLTALSKTVTCLRRFPSRRRTTCFPSPGPTRRMKDRKAYGSGSASLLV